LGIGSCRSHWSCHSQCSGISIRYVSPSQKALQRKLKFVTLHYLQDLFLTYIPNRVKTRLQVQEKLKPTDAISTDPHQHYTSTWDAIRKITNDDGFLGLYAGINGALIGVASTNYAYFYWYSVVRTLYITSQTLPTPPSTLVELSLGAVAGSVAQVFTIPVAVITTRQQTQSKGDKKGMYDTARDVVNSDDGWSGLWRGLKASLVLVVNPAITYGAYQRLREVIFPGKANLRPWEAFRKPPALF
jgi:hypothetical protein